MIKYINLIFIIIMTIFQYNSIIMYLQYIIVTTS